MRMWLDRDNRLLTDEQLLRLIAYRGSLEETLRKDGDIRLVTSPDEARSSSRKISAQADVSTPANSGQTPIHVEPRRTLADYLKEEEFHGKQHDS